VSDGTAVHMSRGRRPVSVYDTLMWWWCVCLSVGEMVVPPAAVSAAAADDVAIETSSSTHARSMCTHSTCCTPG